MLYDVSNTEGTRSIATCRFPSINFILKNRTEITKIIPRISQQMPRLLKFCCKKKRTEKRNMIKAILTPVFLSCLVSVTFARCLY